MDYLPTLGKKMTTFKRGNVGNYIFPTWILWALDHFPISFWEVKKITEKIAGSHLF